MKRKNLMKWTAVATAATMAFSPAMVFAEESEDNATSAGSTISGSGALEDYIKKEVFKVVLPTNSDANFTLDPQGLLKVANSTKYSIGAGAIYFGNKQDDGSYNYSNTSDPIEIINKSSYDIDVDFSVKVTLPEGVTLVESADDLDDATKPSVYLAMKEGSGTATALKSGDNKAATKTVDGVDEDTDAADKTSATGYLITATDDGNGNYTYKYELGDAFDLDTAPKASYILTGSCDTTADWSTLKDKNVSTEIVWKAKKHSDSALSASTVSATANTLTVTDATVSKIVLKKTNGTTVNLSSGTHYTFKDGTLTFVGSVLSGNVGGSIDITLSTGVETVNIQ